MNVTVARKLVVIFFKNLEAHMHAVFHYLFDPGPDNNFVAESERALVFNVRGIHYPSVPKRNEFLHRHFVAALHLIVPCGKNVIQIPRIVDVLVHVNVVGPNLEFGFEL
jgi:hypothetical protein